jgi:hypothetical protein
MRIVKGPQRFGPLVFGVDVLAHVAGGPGRTRHTKSAVPAMSTSCERAANLQPQNLSWEGELSSRSR